MDILNNKWVDLIVMAIILRGRMHGFQLLKEIKRKKKLSLIPVLIHSDKPGMKKLFQRLQIQGFYTKPHQIGSLIKKIKQILRLKGGIKKGGGEDE